MAQPANTFSTYAAKGLREDLSDYIYNITPSATPFVSNAKKGKAKATLHQWQTDALAAADGNNAHIEGDDSTATAATPTVQLTNQLQISKKVISVTGTMEAVDKAGRASEMGLQLAKKGKEIKLDIEKIALGTQVAVAGDDSTPRKCAAFDTWLKTNVSNGATGTNYTYTTMPTAARTAGTARGYTEALLKTVARLQFIAQDSDKKLLFMSPVNKQIFSGFAGLGQTRFNQTSAKQSTIIGGADIYVGDFGMLTAVPSRHLADDRVYLVDPDFVEIDYLRPFKVEDLAKTGDSQKKHLIAEWTLKVMNEGAHGVIRDLNGT